MNDADLVLTPKGYRALLMFFDRFKATYHITIGIQPKHLPSYRSSEEFLVEMLNEVRDLKPPVKKNTIAEFED
jgi:hypothetical protein